VAAPARIDLAADLRLPPSSLSRRLDRLQEEGWIARHRDVPDADLRAVEVELTRTGRRLWREMNVTYRRALQAQFAVHLDDADIADIARVLDTLFGIETPDEPPPPRPSDEPNPAMARFRLIALSHVG
jgi:DNA-binding MarR family transcriptional regulator